MKKYLVAISVLALGVVSFAPAASAQAHHRHYNQEWKMKWLERKCDQLERKEIRAWHRFDQDKHHRIDRVQRLIDRQERYGCSPDGTIVEQLVERKQFSTLAAALTQANLVDTLNSDGDFTVFAPTNQAFEKLGAETIEAVLADQELLTNILTYHVVDPTKVTSAVPAEVAVTLSSAPMFNGQDVQVEIRSGALFINDSEVIVTDLRTTNGIVHVIDSVLLAE